MIRTTLLSAVALALAVSTPAVAQSGADLDQVRESLGDAGIEERRDFEARLVRADTADGETVYMLLTPRDLGSYSEIDVDMDDLRERLESAGLAGIQPVEDARFVIGDLDAHPVPVDLDPRHGKAVGAAPHRGRPQGDDQQRAGGAHNSLSWGLPEGLNPTTSAPREVMTRPRGVRCR